MFGKYENTTHYKRYIESKKKTSKCIYFVILILFKVLIP